MTDRKHEVQTTMFGLREVPPPADNRKRHTCVSIDIDRFDDAKIARDWLPEFPRKHGDGTPVTVAHIRKLCAHLRARGFKVFPNGGCVNVRADGSCGGCP